MHTAELDLIHTTTSIEIICTITELTDITNTQQDHTSNTWRNSGGRRTSVSSEMYTEPRDENKTHDSYTTQNNP